MNFVVKNWKTTVAGVIILLVNELGRVGIQVDPDTTQFLVSAAAFIGFLLAGDAKNEG